VSGLFPIAWHSEGEKKKPGQSVFVVLARGFSKGLPASVSQPSLVSCTMGLTARPEQQRAIPVGCLLFNQNFYPPSW